MSSSWVLGDEIGSLGNRGRSLSILRLSSTNGVYPFCPRQLAGYVSFLLRDELLISSMPKKLYLLYSPSSVFPSLGPSHTVFLISPFFSSLLSSKEKLLLDSSKEFLRFSLSFPKCWTFHTLLCPVFPFHCCTIPFHTRFFSPFPLKKSFSLLLSSKEKLLL